MQDTTQTTAQAAVATPAAAQVAATFMTADQARDWAWNNVREYVGTEGWTVMDSVNFHGFFLYGWNYRGQYELQRTATRTAVMQEILSAAPAAVAVPDGWRLVPVDPTEQMEQAAADYLGECVKAWGLWKAMIASAPEYAALAATPAATESREELAHRLIGEVKTADAIATAICQRVAELGDRSSPGDWPEAMLVTGDELHLIAREAVIEAQETSAAAAPVVQTHAEAAAALGINSALTRIRAGNHAEAIKPLEHALRVLAATPAAAAPASPDDAEIIAALEAAGVEFLKFFGGLDGRTLVHTTSGSQKASNLIAGCRALLATATGLPAQAVAYIDSEVLTSFLSSNNYRPEDGWDCHIRHQENKRDTDVPLYSRPQARAGARDALTPAARDVLAERQRQITQEGNDPQHDDDHVNDEIAAMAALFIMPEGARDWDAASTSYGDTLAEALLPSDWEIPNFGDDRRRQLVKGTAMGLAEIERIDRAAIAAAKGE
ncbi:MAG: hypothetical protein WBF95_08920 [Comamonas thiooxydans]